jgi:hypothetical protein
MIDISGNVVFAVGIVTMGITMSALAFSERKSELDQDDIKHLVEELVEKKMGELAKK